jgi:DNA segregation ATPase FtsK/SpoIIIE-like protein
MVVVDEFAQLVYQNADPHLTNEERKKHKAIQDKMIADLCRLGMLGRAAGITLICATQKPTADAIPTALRHNLDAAIIFRSSRLLTSSIISETVCQKATPSHGSMVQCAIFRVMLYDSNSVAHTPQ